MRTRITGTRLEPGEISLAYHGALMPDEFPRSATRVLEMLRQPIEDKVVRIYCAEGSLTFAANFDPMALMTGIGGVQTKWCCA